MLIAIEYPPNTPHIVMDWFDIMFHEYGIMWPQYDGEYWFTPNMRYYHA